MGGAIEDMGSDTGAAAQRPGHSGSGGAHGVAATAPRSCPPQGLGAVSQQQQGSTTGRPTLCWGPQPVWGPGGSQQSGLTPGWGRHAWRRRAVAPVCPRPGNRPRGPGRGGGRGGVALGGGLGGDAPQRHAGEAQPHALGIEGLDLAGLPLEQTPDPLGAPRLQGQQFFFYLGAREREQSPVRAGAPPSPARPAGRAPYPLLQQRPPQSHPLLQLPQLPLVLALRADLDLALVGIEQLQLLLQLLPKRLELGLLGLIKPQLGRGGTRFRGLPPAPTIPPCPR